MDSEVRPEPAERRVADPGDVTARELQARVRAAFSDFPFLVRVRDWDGHEFEFGGETAHWLKQPLCIHIKNAAAGKDAANLDGLAFLERFRNGEIDLTGNLYVLSELRDYGGLTLSLRQLLGQVFRVRMLQFQDQQRARNNVKTHYDIPQDAINLYLDQVYKAYSCAMFEDPTDFDVEAMTTPGKGETDNYDSLEKAQWRKFRDAVDFLDPDKGDTILDIGCGYGGQLSVALEHGAFSKVAGWTLSANQVREGRKMLAVHDPDLWELNEGDYRQDSRVFDHITSTGMVSHVGPRGLQPYVRNIRQRIRAGGRYVHHAIMTRHSRTPLDAEIGVAFNKRYVWPGFHWFTLGEHIRALEKNGFEVVRAVNLAPNYAKTIAAWYERMMLNRSEIKRHLGEAGFRAWQIYLTGGSQGLLSGQGKVYRVYCRAV